MAPYGVTVSGLIRKKLNVKLLKNPSSRFWTGQRTGLLALALSAALAACGTAPQDEYANINSDKLYADAKEEQADGNFETAVKMLEKVEARASGTLLAQQAQLDLAYAYYRSGEKALALAKLERFIRLHPTSPAMDYAYYLQGLINFNEDLGCSAAWHARTCPSVTSRPRAMPTSRSSRWSIASPSRSTRKTRACA